MNNLNNIEKAKKMSTREKGILGEDLAARHLKKSGYKVLERNWKHKAGEIDIIAKEGETLVFVEVKLRGSDEFGSPAQAVNFRKMSRISKAAGYYIASKYGVEIPMRFDIVEVYADISPQPRKGLKKLLSKKEKHRIEIIRNVLVN